MPENFRHSHGTAAESQDVRQQPSQSYWLFANLSAFFTIWLGHARSIRSCFALPHFDYWPWRSASPWWWCCCANFGALVRRFVSLVCTPKHFAPIIIDCFLLLRSPWNGTQLGLDLVYPMLSITKQQSGWLARLTLEHCRSHQLYEPHASSDFPTSIDYPWAVAVVNLKKTPQVAPENRYSAQSDTYGLTVMLILLEAIVTLIIHLSSTWDNSLLAILNYAFGISLILLMGIGAVFRGEGTLKLAHRSLTSTPAIAVLLDQAFTVVLNGDQGIIEGISESGFDVSYDHALPLRFRFREERHQDRWLYRTLEGLCEKTTPTILLLCSLLFHPSAPGALIPIFVFVDILLICLSLPRHSLQRPALAELPVILIPRLIPTCWLLLWHIVGGPFSLIIWHFGVYLLYVLLCDLFSVACKARSYPIQTAKFLDALGGPPVRKWQFGTLAAAATFQCLVICHNNARPIRDIDVLAFLDMLIVDERDVWKTWKRRVADRIVHEDVVLFAPTVPTFPDERQQQLKDLLDQAQFGYDTYRRFYDQGSPAIPDRPRTDANEPTVFSLFCSAIGLFFSSLRFTRSFSPSSITTHTFTVVTMLHATYLFYFFPGPGETLLVDYLRFIVYSCGPIGRL